jgi:hypothetical protein
MKLDHSFPPLVSRIVCLTLSCLNAADPCRHPAQPNRHILPVIPAARTSFTHPFIRTYSARLSFSGSAGSRTFPPPLTLFPLIYTFYYIYVVTRG